MSKKIPNSKIKRKQVNSRFHNACMAGVLAASCVLSVLPVLRQQFLQGAATSGSTCVGLQVISDDGGSVSGDDACDGSASSSSEASSASSSSSPGGQTSSSASSSPSVQQSQGVRAISLALRKRRATLRMGGISVSQEGKTVLDPLIAGTSTTTHAQAPGLPSRLCTSTPFAQVLPQCKRLVRRMVRVEKQLHAAPRSRELMEEMGGQKIPNVNTPTDIILREDDSLMRRFLRGLLRLLHLIDQ